MESRDEWRQRFHHEHRILARLRLATTRLEEAQQERIWGIAAARALGLSIRQIATATQLSPSRVHQLLQTEEAQRIPQWLSQLRDPEVASEALSDAEPPEHLYSRLTAEVAVLRHCIDWLAQLERGEDVVVNLRPETEVETEYVRFDHAQVRRVLARIAADLETLVRFPLADEEAPAEGEQARRAEHRRRLAAPEPPPKRLSPREQRDALRAAFGMPPYVRRS